MIQIAVPLSWCRTRLTLPFGLHYQSQVPWNWRLSCILARVIYWIIYWNDEDKCQHNHKQPTQISVFGTKHPGPEHITHYIWSTWTPSQYKDGLSRYVNFHCKDKTVGRPSYIFIMGIFILLRRHLYIVTDSRGPFTNSCIIIPIRLKISFVSYPQRWLRHIQIF